MGCIGMACDTVGRANSPIRESLAAPSPPEQGRSTVDSLPRKAGKARFPRSSGFRAERGHRAGRSPRSRPKSTRLVLTGMRQLASCGAAATPVAAALLVSDKTGHAGRGNASGAHTTGSPAHRRKRGSPYGEQDPPETYATADAPSTGSNKSFVAIAMARYSGSPEVKAIARAVELGRTERRFEHGRLSGPHDSYQLRAVTLGHDELVAEVVRFQ